MKYRKLGRTELLVSEIGFGAWTISGRGYGPTDDGEFIRALHRALDLEVNFIDTAEVELDYDEPRRIRELYRSDFLS